MRRLRSALTVQVLLNKVSCKNDATLWRKYFFSLSQDAEIHLTVVPLCHVVHLSQSCGFFSACFVVCA